MKILNICPVAVVFFSLVDTLLPVFYATLKMKLTSSDFTHILF